MSTENTETLRFPVCAGVDPNICRMAPTIAEQRQAVEDLEKWQSKQNGSLQRLEEKMDGLKSWLLGFTATALLAMAGWVIVLLSKKG